VTTSTHQKKTQKCTILTPDSARHRDGHTQNSRRLPVSHKDQHTLASERPRTRSLERKFQGETIGLLRSPPLPPAARMSHRDPDVTHILDSELQGQETESCPTAPGDAPRMGTRGVGRRTRPPPTPKARSGRAARVPRASRRFIYKQCARLRVGEEGPNHPPPRTPISRAPEFRAPLKTQGTRTSAVVRPPPQPAPAGTPRGVLGGKGTPLTSSSESP
jgi:hypothetical protein